MVDVKSDEGFSFYVGRSGQFGGLVHAYTHPYSHACVHACVHPYSHACVHACVHAHARTHRHDGNDEIESSII